MEFTSLSSLVQASNNNSINNNDNIFYNHNTKKFYTKGRFVSAMYKTLRYIGEKISKLDVFLPKRLELREKITSFQAKYIDANHLLSAEYMPFDASHNLTGKSLKEFIALNHLTADKIPYEISVLSLTCDKFNTFETFHQHILSLISNGASISHIRTDMVLGYSDFVISHPDFLNNKIDGRYLLTDILMCIDEKIKGNGKITEWHQDLIQLFIKDYGARITNVDKSGLSTISRAINDKYHPDLISFLIDITPAESLNLQENENNSVLDKAMLAAKNDPKNEAMLNLLEKIVAKITSLDLVISAKDHKPSDRAKQLLEIGDFNNEDTKRCADILNNIITKANST